MKKNSSLYYYVVDFNYVLPVAVSYTESDKFAVDYDEQ